MRKLLSAGRAGTRPSAPLGALSTDDPILRLSRRPWRGLVALVLAAVLGACEMMPTGPSFGSAAGAEEEFVSLVNRHRASIGCPGLGWDPRLAGVAARHSQDMATRGFFAHVTPDGVDPWRRLAQAGVRYGTAGENIAHGVDSGSEAFRMWMNSAPHRRNIENCAFTHHGVGTYEGRWTHLFIRPL